MASVSNSFSLLTGGHQVDPAKKRNKKKNKKKGGQDESSPGGVEGKAPAPEQAPASIGQQAPTYEQLESMVKNVSESRECSELMQTWTTDLAMEKGFIGGNGKPVSFRSVLLGSRALECCAEACVTLGGEGLEQSVYRLLEEGLKATDPKVIQQVLLAVGKVASVVHGHGSEIEGAGKRAVRDLVAALKATDKFQSERERGNWNKSGKSRAKRSAVPERKPARGENKTDFDLSLAMDEMKVRLSDLDAVRQEHFGSDDALKGVTAGASKTIANLKFVMSLAIKQDDGFNDVPKKGKKGKGKGPSAAKAQPQAQAHKAGLMEPFNKEAQELHEQELSLQADITALETRLTSLKAQLVAIKDAQGQLENRKALIASSAVASGRPLIPKDQQDDVVGSLDGVVSELEAMSTATNDEDDAFVRMYVIAAEKVIGSCLAKLEEVLKNVKFLKDALLRKRRAEEQLMGMSAGSSRKDLLNSNKKQREKLEQQLGEAKTTALSVAGKAEKVVTDAGVRSDALGKDTVSQLEDMAKDVKRMHQDILKEGAISKSQPSVANPEPEPNGGTPKKKFDASLIIKQAEMEAKQDREMQQQRARRGPNPQGPPPRQTGPQTAVAPTMDEPRVAPPTQQSQANMEQQMAPPVQRSSPSYAPPQPVTHEQATTSPGAPIVSYEEVPTVAAPVTIPSIEDEMVPPPVTDRVDGHFSPIGNGAHGPGAQPVAPIAPQVASIAPPVQPPNPSPIMPIQPRQPYTAPAPRGWKKIDRAVPVDIGGGAGAPTPAEAREMELKGGK